MTKPRNLASLTEIHIATLLFGFVGPTVSLISAPVLTIAAGRSLAALLVAAVLFLSTGSIPRPRSTRDVGGLAALGVIQCLQWLTFFLAVKMSSVAIALVAVFTFPLFVTVLEPLFFGGRATRAQIVGSLVILLGVAITIPELSLGNVSTRGALWGLSSACLVAASLLLQRGYIRHYTADTLLLFKNGVSVMILVPWVAVGAQLLPTIDDIWRIAALGAVFTAVPFLLMAKSLERLRAQQVGSIISLELVYGIAFASLLTREIPSLQVVLGGALILGVTLHTSLTESTTSSATTEQ
ncbi:MAG: DMT family transporter [Gemmatimonadetes bacterium]|jgi:drug/metabolite transporter (DMT)-like permease|nr:DMT family transporter [Gemmatimonadota bacterium]MBT5962035.1 DMT family transporter [Gemmatimonadota bacterium]MBT7596089.1 DMT family transporter [Gemmatimonadota bacterium]